MHVQVNRRAGSTYGQTQVSIRLLAEELETCESYPLRVSIF